MGKRELTRENLLKILIDNRNDNDIGSKIIYPFHKEFVKILYYTFEKKYVMCSNYPMTYSDCKISLMKYPIIEFRYYNPDKSFKFYYDEIFIDEKMKKITLSQRDKAIEIRDKLIEAGFDRHNHYILTDIRNYINAYEAQEAQNILIMAKRFLRDNDAYKAIDTDYSRDEL